MKYDNFVEGIFIERPNRFIAVVEINGERKICHVKNTGRCKELLIKDAIVILERSNNPNRKTEYDLIAVYKGENLINIDSIAPNKVFGEWAENSGYFGRIDLIKAEKTYKKSRFDYYIESGERKIFIEVKGVTLEDNGIMSFPDAPTERGIKHIRELMDAKENGFEAYIFFVAQMKNCKYFTPNRERHPQFAEVLREASDFGVEVKCVNCNVWEDGLEIDGFINIKL